MPGYTVAGKTGTARKPNDNGIPGYKTGAYVSTFAGFVPAENPQLSIIVVIDEPSTSIYASVVAAPLFAELANLAVRQLPRGSRCADPLGHDGADPPSRTGHGADSGRSGRRRWRAPANAISRAGEHDAVAQLVRSVDHPVARCGSRGSSTSPLTSPSPSRAPTSRVWR